uniref:Peroxisomal biogenesis factor 19 n=2 Tax=Phasianus colchicus TaxID=9054 RepID=A0A669QMD1_PHACC
MGVIDSIRAPYRALPARSPAHEAPPIKHKPRPHDGPCAAVPHNGRMGAPQRGAELCCPLAAAQGMELHGRAVGGAWRRGWSREVGGVTRPRPPSLRRWRGANMAAEPGPGSDPELEELLESALDDFEKARPGPPAPPPPPHVPGDPNATEKPPGAAAQESLFASQERFFQELFDGELASQASAEFERAMKELAEEEPHLVEQFQKLSEAAGRVGGDAASQQEFTSCLKETLSGLARNATDLQGSAASEEDLAKAMEGLGLEEGSGEGGMLPVVQSVLQHLLSRDVLYPSLKEITDKYPEWLQRHRAALPEEQYERYRAQHGVMGRICQQLEAERPEDSEGDRRARFEAVLELMQQLQELGHPPKELAGEAPPGFNLDLEGLTLPEATGEQCHVM